MGENRQVDVTEEFQIVYVHTAQGSRAELPTS